MIMEVDEEEEAALLRQEAGLVRSGRIFGGKKSYSFCFLYEKVFSEHVPRPGDHAQRAGIWY